VQYRAARHGQQIQASRTHAAILGVESIATVNVERTMAQGPDPFEFIKNFWANVPGMGGGAGMGASAMPSFDPKDLEKKLAELKQVKQWLEMNLNMLNLQINTMEMQLSTFNSFKGESPAGNGFSMPPREPSGPPDMSHANQAASDAAKAAGEAGAQAIAQGAQALQAMPWANPGEWLKSIQSAFGPAHVPAKKAGGARAQPAAKKAPAKKAAAKSSLPKGGSASKGGARSATGKSAPKGARQAPRKSP
jgi:hypothetical protein